MKTDTTQLDNISAMMDGELSNAQWESALARLSDEEDGSGKKNLGNLPPDRGCIAL